MNAIKLALDAAKKESWFVYPDSDYRRVAYDALLAESQKVEKKPVEKKTAPKKGKSK